MKAYRCHKTAVMLLLLVLLTSLSGCSKNEPEQKPQGQGQNTQNESREPESFTKIVKETDTLIMALGNKTNFIEMPTQEQGGSESGQQQQGQQQQGQQQQGQQQQGQQQQGQQQQGQQQQGQQQQGQQQQGQQQGTAGWTKEQESIRKINQQWNSLEPEAIKAGLAPELRDRFEKTMEDLTMSISDRKAQPSLLEAIELYRHYGNMASALNSKLPPPYYRVKYEVMMIAALANMPQWEAAKQHADTLIPNWEMLKMKDEGQNRETFTKTEYSLNDVKRAVELQQRHLVMIKAEIAIQNLEDLRKKLTQNKGGKSGGQNGQGQQGSSQQGAQGSGQNSGGESQ